MGKYIVTILNEEDLGATDLVAYGPFSSNDKAVAFAAKCTQRVDRLMPSDAPTVIRVQMIRQPLLRNAYSEIDRQCS